MPNMVFTASRSAGDDISVPISIPFTVGGTATFASDYTVAGAVSFTATNGSMIIPAGQASAAMTISTVPDATAEADETIILTPTAQAGSWVVGTSAWTGTITNDDAAFVISNSRITSLRFESFPFVDDRNGNTITNNSVSLTTAGISGTGSGVFTVGSRMSVLLNTPIGTGDFTIQCKVKFNSAPTNAYLWDWSAGNNYFVAYVNGQWVAFLGGFIMAAAAAVNTTSTYSVALCRNGSTDKLYIDGVQVASVSRTIANLPATITIGNYFDATFDRSAQAIIDDFSIDNIALFN